MNLQINANPGQLSVFLLSLIENIVTYEITCHPGEPDPTYIFLGRSFAKQMAMSVMWVREYDNGKVEEQVRIQLVYPDIQQSMTFAATLKHDDNSDDGEFECQTCTFQGFMHMLICLNTATFPPRDRHPAISSWMPPQARDANRVKFNEMLAQCRPEINSVTTL